MSFKKYEEGCPGCRPVVLDVKTMQPLPPDHPLMIVANQVWTHTTREEREAFHDFTCCNSRDPKVLMTVRALSFRLQQAMEVRGN